MKKEDHCNFMINNFGITKEQAQKHWEHMESANGILYNGVDNFDGFLQEVHKNWLNAKSKNGKNYLSIICNQIFK